VITVRNWAGNITFSAPSVARPTTVEQLQELVSSSARLRALGTGHSFNPVADAPAMVSVADLPADIAVDERARVVEAGAGMTFHQLAQALAARGWALPNMGSLPHISLAGACATGTHGSGSALRCLPAYVVGVELVRADGELVRLDRDHPAFPGVGVSLGALGIITRVRIQVLPAYSMRQQVQLDVPLDAVLADVDSVMGSGRSVSLFSGWSEPGIVDSIWFKTELEHEGELPPDITRWGGRPARTPQHPIRGIDPAATTEQLGVPGPWHERLPHFRAEFTPSAGHEQQSEFLLPREHAASAVEAVARLDLSAVLQVCEVRTVAADDLWLSPFQGRDSVAIHFTWIDDDDLVRAGVRRVEQALASYDPRPHWGKVFTLPPAQIRARYPHLADFQELAAVLDPNRTFGNEFLDAYVYA
jgi:alditol oxidase